MHYLLNNFQYFWIGTIGLYVIISSYFLSKICFKKMGGTEIFWFFLLNFLYPFLLCYLLIHPIYKNRLTLKETKFAILSLITFLVILLTISIPFLMHPFDNSSYSMDRSTNIEEKTTEKIGLNQLELPDWLINTLILLIPLYHVFVSYCVSEIMKKIESERSWFYAWLFYPYIIIIYIFASAKYRQRLKVNDKLRIATLAMGYSICLLIAMNAFE